MGFRKFEAKLHNFNSKRVLPFFLQSMVRTRLNGEESSDVEIARSSGFCWLAEIDFQCLVLCR